MTSSHFIPRKRVYPVKLPPQRSVLSSNDSGSGQSIMDTLTERARAHKRNARWRWRAMRKRPEYIREGEEAWNDAHLLQTDSSGCLSIPDSRAARRAIVRAKTEQKSSGTERSASRRTELKVAHYRRAARSPNDRVGTPPRPSEHDLMNVRFRHGRVPQPDGGA